MRRKTAIATAGTVVAVLLAGSVATAANLGILSSTSETEVGELPSTTIPATSSAPTQVETVVVEDPVPVTAPASDPAVPSEQGEFEDFDAPSQSFEDETAHEEHEEHEEHEGDEDDD